MLLMYRYFLVAWLAAFTFLTSALPALAHQRQAFNINGKTYLFTIGSIGEPVYVDDKSGVDLRIKLADPKDPGNGSSPLSVAVEGLEKTLQVELTAADQKKILPLEPAYKDPGAYHATFFPTVATTLSYRVFGLIDNTPVDLTFTCLAEGETAASNTDSVQISAGVSRVFTAGGFGCPHTKDEAGFPEPSSSLRSLTNTSVSGDSQSTSPNNLFAVLSIAGVIIGLIALVRTGKR